MVSRKILGVIDMSSSHLLQFVLLVKQEPTPSSPSQGGLKLNLPATPKSSNGDKGEEGSGEQQQQSSATDNTGDQEQQPQDERMETDARTSSGEGQIEMEVDAVPEEKHFVLAPTPAQLGKAPLQRRLASSCSQDSSKDLSPTELPPNSASSFSGMFAASVQQQSSSVGGMSTATVTNPALFTPMDEPPPTSANSKKKQFFKKAKNDDMDT